MRRTPTRRLAIGHSGQVWNEPYRDRVPDFPVTKDKRRPPMSNRLAFLPGTSAQADGSFRRYAASRFSAALLALAVLVQAVPALARPAPDSFADMAEKLLPAVVNVSTTQTVQST